MQYYLLRLANTYVKNYAGLSYSTWRGIILHLIESTMIGVFYFLAIYFVTELHFTILMAGTILSCYGLGAIPGGLIGGKLSDKFSPNRVSAACLLIQSVGYLALIKMTNPYALMINLIFLGFASYGFITSNSLFVLQQSDSFESTRLRSINLLSTTSNLGLGISALVIGQISHFGFHPIFLTSSFVLLLLSYFTFTYSPPKITEKVSSVKSNTQARSNSLIPFILLCVFFVGMIISQMSAAYPLYIKNTFSELGMRAVSILFFLNTILVILLEVPIGNFLANYNKINVLGIGGFLIGLGMFILSISSYFVLAVISCIIYTIGEIIFFCVAQLVCYQKASENKKGHGLGLFRMIFAGSRILGPLAGGYIYYHCNGKTIWYICGLIGICCLLGCLYYNKE